MHLGNNTLAVCLSPILSSRIFLLNLYKEHITKWTSPELWDSNRVNDFKSTSQPSPERVTKALFSESVEVKLWTVAAHALGSVRTSPTFQ
jgi:hypothetical protein